MKNYISLTSTALLLCIAQPVYSTPTTITDTYIGGDEHGYGDVIGSNALFDTHSMDVELIGNMLSVSIYTNFAGHGDDGLFSSYTSSGNGIGYGDLFLSDSWNPYGSAGDGYIDDNSSNGTSWSYAFSLDDRWSNGNTGALYSLDGDNSDVLLSEDFLTGATFRDGQEIAVDTSNKTAVAGTEGTSWTVTSDSINFLIDISGTTLEGSDTIALHWGMTCGNDTIEGAYSVPEPALLGLMALGLIGIGASGRTRK